MEKVSKKKESEQQQQMIVCRRCKETYNPSSNHSSACRFHPTIFVCRRHDDQKRICRMSLSRTRLLDQRRRFKLVVVSHKITRRRSKMWKMMATKEEKNRDMGKEMKPMVCMRCRDTYTLFTNSDAVCKYHPLRQ